MTAKIITWNVNGLRSILSKNFDAFVQKYKPDVLCLQETKVYGEVCPEISGFDYKYFNHCEVKKGYSGTAILSNKEPKNIRLLDVDPQHPEGRIIIAEFEDFYLVNTYVPNAQSELQRLPYRVQVWDANFRKLLVDLQREKSVLWCGDLNVAHRPIDLENPETHHFHAGFTDQERQSFSQTLDCDLVDVFRSLHPDVPKQYSWWSYRMKARERNVGWRIDYFVASKDLLPCVNSCEILSGVMGSDHAPVQLVLEKML